MNLIKVFCVTAVASCLATNVEFFRDFFRDKQGPIMICNTYQRQKYLELMKNFENKSITVSRYTDKEQINILTYLKRIHHIYFVADMQNWNGSMNILNKMKEQNIFIYPIRLLVIIYQSDFEKLSQLVAEFPILPNVELTIGIQNDNFVDLQQPYKVHKTRDIIWEKYGNWSKDQGLVENYKNVPTSRRRSNLMQAQLRVGVRLASNDSLNHLTDFRYPVVDAYTKQVYGALECTLEFVNATYIKKLTTSYGYYDPKLKEFDGLVGLMAHNEIDISVALFMVLGRDNYIDFIYAGSHFRFGFVIRKPSTSYVKDIFFLTFTPQVWFSILIILVIFATIARIVFNIEAKYQDTDFKHTFSVSDVVLLCLEGICQQGTTIEPRHISGRIITFIFFVALMFVYVSYSAYIVVLLQSTTTLKNLKELLNSRIEVAGHKIDYMKNYFEAPKEGILHDLYRKKIYPNNYLDGDVGMKRLQQDSFAFHLAMEVANNYILYNFTNYETCGLQELPGFVQHTAAYTGIPKKSPYKEIFSTGVIRVSEHGIMRRFDQRVNRKPKCYAQSASFKSVGIYDCRQIFLIWSYGVILAIIIFILEKILKFLSDKHICTKIKLEE